MANKDDKQTNTESADAITFCYFCGAPEPCRKNACIQAAFAEADYYDAIATKGKVN